MQWQCETCGQLYVASQEFLPACPLCGGETHLSSKAEIVNDETQSHIKAIHRAVTTVLYPDELYERFLTHLTAALAGYGAAIWHVGDEGGAELRASVGCPSDRADSDWEKHVSLIDRTMAAQGTEQMVITVDDPQNPTPALLLLQKVHPRCPLVIEAAQREDSPTPASRGHAVFLQRMAYVLSQARCIPWN